MIDPFGSSLARQSGTKAANEIKIRHVEQNLVRPVRIIHLVSGTIAAHVRVRHHARQEDVASELLFRAYDVVRHTGGNIEIRRAADASLCDVFDLFRVGEDYPPLLRSSVAVPLGV